MTENVTDLQAWKERARMAGQPSQYLDYLKLLDTHELVNHVKLFTKDLAQNSLNSSDLTKGKTLFNELLGRMKEQHDGTSSDLTDLEKDLAATIEQIEKKLN